MKILILGATGMAGHTITLYFIEKGYDVTTYSLTPFPYSKNVIGNAFEIKKLKNIIIAGNFDVIINCIGILNNDAEENQSKAIFLNSYLPHFISDTIRLSKCKLIHMSTDCVFNGNTGPYFEHSFRDGKTFYDRTKALGEIENKKDLTFRNSIIGPDLNLNGIGLFNWFMKQKGTIMGYTTAIWTGVTSITLAKAMEQAINENLCGIYNLVNNCSISKFQLLNFFNNYFRDNEVNIIESDSVELDKSLKCNRTDFTFKVPSYEEMIIEMKEWTMNHKNLYSHYTL